VVLLGVLIGVGAYLLISNRLVLGLLSLSFVPFVAWRSSVTQLALRSTWLTLQQRLSVLSRVMDENLGGHPCRACLCGAAGTSWKSSTAPSGMRWTSPMNASAIARQQHSAMTSRSWPPWAWVLWFGSQKVIGGSDQRRHAGAVPHLHDHPTDAGAPARLMVNSFARAVDPAAQAVEVIDAN